jgi:NACHT domain
MISGESRPARLVAGRALMWAGGFVGAVAGNLIATKLTPATGLTWIRIGAVIAGGAILAVAGWLLGRLVRATSPVPGGAEVPVELRQALLGEVRRRSYRQLDTIVQAPAGVLDLRLAPRLGLVVGGRSRKHRTEQRRAATGDTIIEAFEHAGRRLLIIGEPGAGKTVLAYQLIEFLDEIALDDPAAPMPILLNLASWQPQSSLADWTVDQLCDPNAGYGFPDRALARSLLAGHRFALILDGLDECSDPQSCRDAVNNYLTTLPNRPGLGQVVVTCRSAAYRNVIRANPTSRLSLLAAREALPLDDGTIRHNINVLANGSDQRLPDERWRVAADQLDVAQTRHLRSAMASPLLLSLAVESNVDPTHLLSLTSSAAVSAAILAASLEQTLNLASEYPAGAARRWLEWLASFLRYQSPNPSTFYFEHLTPTRPPGFMRVLGAPAIFVRIGALTAIPFGLIVGLGVGLIFGSHAGWTAGLSTTLVVGVISGARSIGRDVPDVQPAHLSFRLPRSHELLDAFFWGAVNGLVLGAVFAVFSNERAGVAVGVGCGAVIWLGYAFRKDAVGIVPSEPDQGLKRSRRAWVSTGIEWLLVGAIAGRVAGAVIIGAMVGLMIGLDIGLGDGGAYVVLQGVRRRRLLHENHLPRHPREFLDWAVERRVMRRVGGGYEFRHLLMRDVLALENQMRVEVRLIAEANEPT